jgi:hypothetical protein
LVVYSTDTSTNKVDSLVVYSTDTSTNKVDSLVVYSTDTSTNKVDSLVVYSTDTSTNKQPRCNWNIVYVILNIYNPYPFQASKHFFTAKTWELNPTDYNFECLKSKY